MHDIIGQAVVLLSQSSEKQAAQAEIAYSLTGKLVLSKTGWLLLTVPNALATGAFAALNEPGIELPPGATAQDPFNAHISVMSADEVASIEGGADAITERGKEFAYTLGPLRSVVPSGWADVARCWFIEVTSPELKKLRQSYGLTPLPKNNTADFHITVAVRRKHVFKTANLIYEMGRQSKQAAAIPPEAVQTPVEDKRPYRDRAEMYPLKGNKIFGGLYNDTGSFGVFGGGIESGEDPAEAAAREFLEETGWQVKNPRLLDIEPHISEWKPPYHSPQQEERAKKYRGSRTFYVTGELGDRVAEKPSDTSKLTNPGEYDLAEAIRLARGDETGSLGAINAKRRAVLTQLAEQLQKQATDDLAAHCPECGEPYKWQCRCRINNRGCKNGHNWYTCPVHRNRVLLGTGHGKGFGCHCDAGEEKQAELYHGSQHDVDTLEPRPSRVINNEQAVFATPSKALAMSYLAPWTDDDFAQGSVNNQLYMKEQYPGAFDKVYKNKSGVLYNLPDAGFVADKRLMRSELINRVPVTPTSKELVKNVLAALQQQQEMRLYRHDETGPDEDTPATEKSVTKSSPLQRLKAIKRYSDQGNYKAKHQLAREMIQATPADFVIDSEAGHVAGITHVPTGFRFHLPRKAVPGGLAKQTPVAITKTASLAKLFSRLARAGGRTASGAASLIKRAPARAAPRSLVSNLAGNAPPLTTTQGFRGTGPVQLPGGGAPPSPGMGSTGSLALPLNTQPLRVNKPDSSWWRPKSLMQRRQAKTQDKVKTLGSLAQPVPTTPPAEAPKRTGLRNWLAKYRSEMTGAPASYMPQAYRDAYKVNPLVQIYNALNTPWFAPLTKGRFPRLTAAANLGAKATTTGIGVVGLASLPSNTANNSANLVGDALALADFDQEAIEAAKSRVRSQLYSKYLPAVRSDDSELAARHRLLSRRSMIPAMRHAAYVNTTYGLAMPVIPRSLRYPLGKALDVVRSVTPGGALTTAGIYGIRRERTDAEADELIRRTFTENPEAYARDIRNLDKPEKSRLLRAYMDLLPGVSKGHGYDVTKRVADDAIHGSPDTYAQPTRGSSNANISASEHRQRDGSYANNDVVFTRPSLLPSRYQKADVLTGPAIAVGGDNKPIRTKLTKRHMDMLNLLLPHGFNATTNANMNWQEGNTSSLSDQLLKRLTVQGVPTEEAKQQVLSQLKRDIAAHPLGPEILHADRPDSLVKQVRPQVPRLQEIYADDKSYTALKALRLYQILQKIKPSKIEAAE